MNNHVLQIVTVALACCWATGCVPPELKSPEHRAELVAHWCHEIGQGVPHRCSVLRDGTELITVGQYNRGQYLQLIRYPGEEKFQVIQLSGGAVQLSEWAEKD